VTEGEVMAKKKAIKRAGKKGVKKGDVYFLEF
jgi:hypothetical protein